MSGLEQKLMLCLYTPVLFKCASNGGYICHWVGGGGILSGDVPLEEFMYLVFTRMPGESYRRRLRSLLLCLCDVFRALIHSLVC